ncbi:glyoxalase [Nocardia yunnanensis]|uniref:Glyoxalase n=1 Tax=Nocardia yunnanensis TaxID=2382165 RepID=A0A386ZDP6_9NOCA|nr:VOC family protein [Nocardia yunnanensis]AYF74745.1 glyoxalase [Nocardia yunnanensis]
MIERIHPYVGTPDPKASADFYTTLFALEIAMKSPVLGLRAPGNPAAQLLLLPPDPETPTPHLGIDVGDPTQVDAAYHAALRHESKIVYPLTSEPWSVRRFFVEDPTGTIINVLAHNPPR